MPGNTCHIGWMLLIGWGMSSCAEKRIEKQAYGDFVIETITTERERLFWPGKDFLGLDYKVYYKSNKIDFSHLATTDLAPQHPAFRSAELVTLEPFTTQLGRFYCNIGGDTSSAICALYAHHNKPVLTLLIPTVGSPIIGVRPDILNRNEVLYGNYIINEQTLQMHELPVVQKRYNTYNDNYSTAYATFLYGVSPDGQWIVRSFPGSEMSAWEGLYTMFVTNRSTGQSVEFSLEKDNQRLVDSYNERIDEKQRTPQQWFQQNFEWTKDGDTYQLRIKSRQ